MTEPYIKCYFCKHHLEGKTCKAFPNGIPDVIWTNEVEHTKPYEGDNGIRFEKIEDNII